MPKDSSQLKAGFIGLGAMGVWMARHLATEGLLEAVWNRTSTKAAAFSAELNVPLDVNFSWGESWGAAKS
ncbi:MAG: NAD(P)-binding domain-containing protein [Ilumatobacteraceae bacterium]